MSDLVILLPRSKYGRRPRAKLWALWLGLNFAKQFDFRKIIIKIDFKVVTHLLGPELTVDNVGYALFKYIMRLLR